MPPNEFIRIKGARQNNLKNLNLNLPLHELIVITGVSGSGKSSLAFDTIYAEGQRRYVETFSPYARQFLDRMDKPQVDRIDGIPPAIAIDQTNPVRTSRSTVGTMTELNDHLKLLFARAARLFCTGCGKAVRRDTPETICADLLADEAVAHEPVLVTFPVAIPRNFDEAEIRELLAKQGYTRIRRKGEAGLEVVQDRVSLDKSKRARLVEDLEAALKYGGGRVIVYPLDEAGGRGQALHFSADLHCPDCDIHYRDPVPNLFSFNSPMGACDTCRGFGRTMGIDYDLVIADERKTLAGGAVKPWQTESYRECQEDLLRFARRRGIPADLPWKALNREQRRWVIEGEGDWDDGVWYGVQRFFDWLETKSYKMHIRVLLSRYRTYRCCPDCLGARLKPASLAWRIGTAADGDRVLPRQERFQPARLSCTPARAAALPGLTIHDVMLLPIVRCREFFEKLHLPKPLDEATDLLLTEIRSRLRYLVDVGLGYLTLDRQSRTLSGGEVQRINLTTALGTSLVNTLFVLDEPSIGLHARDMARVIGVLKRLRDEGNSLIVVEHDPQVILAADRIFDLGPGPGERGGRVVFTGKPEALRQARRSLTADYLTGRKQVAPETARAGRRPGGDPAYLEILKAAEHNLKEIDVRIPLNRLVCFTGVSGSGKSTLVEDVCYRGLRKLKHKAVEPPGRHDALRGHEQIGEVVLVDQSPIGKTTRSNPASYVGALTAIRKAFGDNPVAQQRGYTASTFSFNSGTGRCPTCSGNGFERVEMQFLSDVYLRCPDCDGQRFRPEVLEVKLQPSAEGFQNRAGRGRKKRPAPRSPAATPGGKSMADVLEMTVSEALAFFDNRPDIRRALEPLAAVGLPYLRLGQPVPTLSGGEAQRLKLAGHLAKSRNGRAATVPTLFLFDEPTTGLHFDDIATLLNAFQKLLAEGHSLFVIEHNLDVIEAADWIIDLGPEGGDAGGRLVCAGSPNEIARCRESRTGEVLRNRTGAAVSPAEPRTGKLPAARRAAAPVAASSNHAISIRNAREHNLQGVDIEIPRDRFTVITGISGSGKSTVALDILFAEGQRRYLESLNAYARQFVQPASRPDVDAIHGIPATVAIEQRTSRGGRKSTVATLTEIYHFLRLLFVKLGTQTCPDCRRPIEAQSEAAILARIMRGYRGQRIRLLAPLVVSRKGYYTDLARWAAAKGYSELRVDGAWTPTENWPRLDRFKEHRIELPVGEVTVSARTEADLAALVHRALPFGRGMVQISPVSVKSGKPTGRRNKEALFSSRRACPGCDRSFPELDPRLFSFNSKHGWCESCYGTGLRLPGFDAEQTGEEIWWNDWWEGAEERCPTCSGERLRPEALAVRFHDRTIAGMTSLTVADAADFFGGLHLQGRAAAIARDILPELRSRLRFLKQVGLPYLQLNRAAPTLSGGEAQRIRLASQLGSNLRGVCYILDEPTIGLHARDNRMLLKTLQQLERKGNTVVVVEHDEETIRHAEHIIDLGPGAGKAGGRVVAQGTVAELMAYPESVTGRLLANPLRHPLMERRPTGPSGNGNGTGAIDINGARLHNLKDLAVRIPLARLVCVTGVSGSGKSTLLREVLHDNLHRLLARRRGRRKAPRTALLRGCDRIEGWEQIGRVLEVDQRPIGKTPRSCPATYVKIWDHIRRLFADTPEARLRGYRPGRFSFNVHGGRCEGCQGQGLKKIEMSFLPDVKIPCDVCGGARFNEETLRVSYKERHIADVLALSVDEAVDFFAAHASIHRTLKLLQDVGLGYLTLGQQSPTLSGGEAQRIKLVTELAKAKPAHGRPSVPGRKAKAPQRDVAAHVLYVLDEPTIGLHGADVEKLIRVLHRLVAAGNTVVIIEHNLDVVAEADWVIDLGPEGGDGGGRIVAQGAPEAVARQRKGSHTARVLALFLKERRPN
jgi:excinuclease ABC subunit A